jgi:hypothetical protein
MGVFTLEMDSKLDLGLAEARKCHYRPSLGALDTSQYLIEYRKK